MLGKLVQLFPSCELVKLVPEIAHRSPTNLAVNFEIFLLGSLRFPGAETGAAGKL
jgi:hypothetical protein